MSKSINEALQISTNMSNKDKDDKAEDYKERFQAWYPSCSVNITKLMKKYAMKSDCAEVKLPAKLVFAPGRSYTREDLPFSYRLPPFLVKLSYNIGGYTGDYVAQFPGQVVTNSLFQTDHNSLSELFVQQAVALLSTVENKWDDSKAMYDNKKMDIKNLQILDDGETNKLLEVHTITSIKATGPNDVDGTYWWLVVSVLMFTQDHDFTLVLRQPIVIPIFSPGNLMMKRLHSVVFKQPEVQVIKKSHVTPLVPLLVLRDEDKTLNSTTATSKVFGRMMKFVTKRIEKNLK